MLLHNNPPAVIDSWYNDTLDISHFINSSFLFIFHAWTLEPPSLSSPSYENKNVKCSIGLFTMFSEVHLGLRHHSFSPWNSQLRFIQCQLITACLRFHAWLSVCLSVCLSFSLKLIGPLHVELIGHRLITSPMTSSSSLWFPRSLPPMKYDENCLSVTQSLKMMTKWLKMILIKLIINYY